LNDLVVHYGLDEHQAVVDAGAVLEAVAGD
jgi:hypothetical protein